MGSFLKDWQSAIVGAFFGLVATAFCGFQIYIQIAEIRRSGGPNYAPHLGPIAFWVLGALLIALSVAWNIWSATGYARFRKIPQRLNFLDPIEPTIAEASRSRSRSAPASIRFVNLAKQDVDIYWIDENQCRQVMMLGIRPHAEWVCKTWLTHVFIVVVGGTGSAKTGTGTMLAGFEAQTTNGDIAVIYASPERNSTEPQGAASSVPESAPHLLITYKYANSNQILTFLNDGKGSIAKLRVGPVRWVTDHSAEIQLAHPVPSIAPGGSQECKFFFSPSANHSTEIADFIRRHTPPDVETYADISFKGTDLNTYVQRFFITATVYNDPSLVWEPGPVRIASGAEVL